MNLLVTETAKATISLAPLLPSRSPMSISSVGGRGSGRLTCIQNPSCKRVWEKPVLTLAAFAVMKENTRSWEECWEPSSCMHCTLWRRDFKRRKKVFFKRRGLQKIIVLYHWMFVSPQNSQVKTKPPKVMGWGGGAFGIWLSHERYSPHECFHKKKTKKKKKKERESARALTLSTMETVTARRCLWIRKTLKLPVYLI